jgi:hypothetical protein
MEEANLPGAPNTYLTGLAANLRMDPIPFIIPPNIIQILYQDP